MLRLLFILLLLLIPALASSDVGCDGVDDILGSGLNADTFVNNNAFTFMAYIKSTGSTYGDNACWNEAPMLGDVIANIALGRSGPGSSACAYYFDNVAERRLTSTISTGWHHIAGRLSSGTLELFVDGVSVQSTTGGNVESLASAFNLCTGTSEGSSPDRITEVKVYDVAVPTPEIARAGKSRIRRADLTPATGYWPLDDCTTAGTLKDRSGNNRHLTRDLGGNASGLTCVGSEFVSSPWGIQ